MSKRIPITKDLSVRLARHLDKHVRVAFPSGRHEFENHWSEANDLLRRIIRKHNTLGAVVIHFRSNVSRLTKKTIDDSYAHKNKIEFYSAMLSALKSFHEIELGKLKKE